MHYETKQGILEEAGLSQRVLAEGAVQGLGGVVDGTNKVFTTSRRPITDSNDDDIVDTTDVTVYVNGVPVRVLVLDEINGIITLATAPPLNSVVTCDYRFSNVSDAYLTKVRDEAEAWINDAMDAIDNVPYGSGTPASNNFVPPTIRKLTRWYAAAQLLIKEYGFNHDTTGTSKDGFAIMARLEGTGVEGLHNYKPGLLAKYIAIGGSTGLSDVSAAEVTSYAEPDLFTGVDPATGLTVSLDDVFMRDMGPDEDGIIEDE